jgi:gp16 family phage-associated protein
MKQIFSPTEARAELRRRGITVREFARRNHISAPTVYEVLGGRKQGHWGDAHRAAVLLGLKDGTIDSCKGEVNLNTETGDD